VDIKNSAVQNSFHVLTCFQASGQRRQHDDRNQFSVQFSSGSKPLLVLVLPRAVLWHHDACSETVESLSRVSVDLIDLPAATAAGYRCFRDLRVW